LFWSIHSLSSLARAFFSDFKQFENENEVYWNVTYVYDKVKIKN